MTILASKSAGGRGAQLAPNLKETSRKPRAEMLRKFGAEVARRDAVDPLLHASDPYYDDGSAVPQAGRNTVRKGPPMSFRLEPEEAVDAGIRRIAVEHLDESIEIVEDATVDRHEAVHEVRRRFKRLRGTIRLVRYAFPKTYAKENAAYRDAAAALSTLRDAQSALDAFDSLVKRNRDQLPPSPFATVRRRLSDLRGQSSEEDGDLSARLAETLILLRTFRERAESWRFKERDFDAIESGLIDVYDCGRGAMKTAYDDPTTIHFHEWRKCVKYHGFHLRILSPIWKAALEAQRKTADKVEEKLGDEHDLSLLVDRISAEPTAFGDDGEITALLELIDARREELRRQARPLGERLFAEKPERLAGRLRSYWDAWRSEIPVSAAQS